MKSLYLPIIGFMFIYFLVGCVSTEMAVDRSTAVKDEKAYVYGKFELQGDDDINIALKLTYQGKSDEHKNKYIELKKNNTVYAVELTPGVYELGKIVFLDTSNRVKFERNLSARKSVVPLTIESGKAYYLGDYKGEVIHVRGRYLKWQLKGLDDNFEETTTAFESDYFHFSSVPKVNLLKGFREGIYSDITEAMERFEKLVKDENYQEALPLVRRYAQEKGLPYAQVRLGNMYEQGLGVEQSLNVAGHWYLKAANRDDPNGMRALGVLLLHEAPSYDSDPDFPRWKMLGLKKDGLLWLRKAALKGDVPAMVINCGFANVKPTTLKIIAESISWCELALERVSDKHAQLRGNLERNYNSVRDTISPEARSLARTYKSAFQEQLETNKAAMR